MADTFEKKKVLRVVNNVRQKIYIFAFIRKNNRKAGYGDLTSASYYISIIANEKQPP
jgi:hypothetical protein